MAHYGRIRRLIILAGVLLLTFFFGPSGESKNPSSNSNKALKDHDLKGKISSSLTSTLNLRHILKRASPDGSSNGDSDSDVPMSDWGSDEEAGADSNVNQPNEPDTNDSPVQITIPTLDHIVAKGCKLLAYMQGTSAEVTTAMIADGKLPAGGDSQSKWIAFADLHTWGWTPDTAISIDLDFDKGLPILPLLTHLKISTTRVGVGQGRNVMMAWDHSREVKIQNVLYEPTEASYSNVYNAQDGVIMGTYNFGPKYEAEDKYGPTYAQEINIPLLEHWSDVTFLQWQSACAAQHQPPSTLHYMLKLHVRNVISVAIIKQLLAAHGQSQAPRFTPDRALTFAADSNEGRALIGIPNGEAVAMFLLQHKAQLGRKTVTAVTVFSDELDDQWPCLVFEVRDVVPQPARRGRRGGGDVR